MESVVKKLIFCALATIITFEMYSNESVEPLLERNATPIETEPTINSSVKKMKGIVLVNDLCALNRIDLNQVEGTYVDESVALPDSFETFQKNLEPLFLNKEINRSNLLSIKNAILKEYNQHKQYMVSIEIPEQDISLGVVAFVVTHARIGEITYCGNDWYSRKRVEKRLSICPGECLDECELLDNISWLNQNPFHYTEAILSPGQEQNQTNLEIVTQDRFPLRVYAGADNTGVESTGTGRFYGGVTWGDAFFIDDLMTYQFTSNSSYHKFHSHSMNYVSFLPWKHIFTSCK